MPKVKKQKQKQKQKQRQTVIVNVNQRAPARRRATSARRSGGGGGIPYPIYLNSPSDLSPIIHNLPAQYQNQPAITMPTNTAPQPSLQALTYPAPTALQTATADVRPLGGSAKKISNIPSRSGGISIAELKNVLNSPSKGLKSIDSRQTLPLEGEFFAPPTRTLSSYPSSISIMSDITTPNELIGNIPRARNQDLTGMTPQQKYERQQLQTAELNKSKKIAKTQHQTFKL